MSECNAHPEQKRLWRALAQGAAPDWEKLFAGYVSCMDFPSVWYWRELISVYPEAKVVLTWRDADSWWTSFERVARAVMVGSDDPDSLGVALVANQIFGGRPLDRDHVVGVYEAHVAAVMAEVPNERLLVHRFGDGWPPDFAPISAFRCLTSLIRTAIPPPSSRRRWPSGGRPPEAGPKPAQPERVSETRTSGTELSAIGSPTSARRAAGACNHGPL